MNTSENSFLKSTWFLGGIAALVVFALCFVGINMVSKPTEEKDPEVEQKVIATLQTNEPLIMIARKQGWIDADAVQLTSQDAAKVKDLGDAFQGSTLQTFSEFQYFVGLQEIAAGAFAHSDRLMSVVIPAQVSHIQDGAFAYCPALMKMSVDTANTHYDSRGDCNGIICTWKGKLMLVAGCRSTIIPDDVRYLAPQAYCGQTALRQVIFPSRMEEIGAEAFKDCTSLQQVEIPGGVRFVQSETFSGCSALEEVVLSKSVERLRKDAFAGCTSLATLICPKRYPPIVENAFHAFTATVCVPAGMQDKYRADKYWKQFRTIKELP